MNSERVEPKEEVQEDDDLHELSDSEAEMQRFELFKAKIDLIES